MSKRRIIFFAIFGLYHLIVFLFIYHVDNQKENIGLLSEIHKSIYLLKYGALIGIVLFLIDFVWSWWLVDASHKEQEALQTEINKIKAKMYDLMEKDEPQVDAEADPGTE